MLKQYGLIVKRIPDHEKNEYNTKPAFDFAILLIILILSVAVAAYFSLTKRIVITGNGQSTAGDSLDETEIYGAASAYDWEVLGVNENGESGQISFSLPITMRAENITVENHYQDNALLIRLRGTDSDYRDGFEVTGNVQSLKAAACCEKNDELLISFLFDGVWEYNISQENGRLIIEPVDAHELYDEVVVIDAGIYSGEDSFENDLSDITEEVAALVSDKVSSDSDSSRKIRVYILSCEKNEETVAGDITSEDAAAEDFGESSINREKHSQFLRECGADIYIGLTLSDSEDAAAYGMSAEYNDKYFNPELTNRKVAESVLRNVATSAKDKALEISTGSADDLLSDLEIPAAIISIGYASNEKERSLLENSDYQAMIADGIVAAINELLE